MRLSMSLPAAAAVLALAACAGQNAGVPATATVSAMTPGIAGDVVQQPDVTSCATTPPQYQWIFKGACDASVKVTSNGGTFSLSTYDDITIKGTIGKNNAKGTVEVALADATDTNGDVEKYKGAAFKAYKAEGKTFVYAVAVNQSAQVVKPIAEKGKPILQYDITDSKGLPGKKCGAAVLTAGSKGQEEWSTIPATIEISGNTLKIIQYNVPNGFEFPPKTPLYFAVNCFTT